jgi:hypothetical protein
VAVSFDHVNHDILMGRIAQVIRDKRVLHLIGKYLRRGAMVDGLVEASVEGTPQGGPLSPLLANIYLDALDKELERRGHRFCRYADDANIYVGSRSAAERTLTSIQGWIEQHLRLKVNAAKSGTGRVWERKFLGFRLDRSKRIGVAPESLERSRQEYGRCGEGTRAGRATSCATHGSATYEAGGVTSNWPKSGVGSSNWSHGSDGISGNASGCGGTMLPAGRMRCAGSGFAADN